MKESAAPVPWEQRETQYEADRHRHAERQNLRVAREAELALFCSAGGLHLPFYYQAVENLTRLSETGENHE
ncbi:MAG TPA: hypothetical protein VKA70_07295 [Blastocatellia bacterium]|nr:hypothetical protein [Blastocatellia bacterium]